ncbi:MAG: hypothetical protein ABSG79_11370 [Bryobacteraceae bacterium]
MRRTLQFSAVVVWVLMGARAFPSDSVLVVNRGLPQANLNNGSGPLRSNVRWGWYDHGFVGDGFTIGSAGERWVIDSIRTWAVPGDASHLADHLGDFFEDMRLYFGGSDTGLTPVSTAGLTRGSDETSNGNVRITEATQAGALLYDDFGASLRIWQVEFGNLNLTVQGGVPYRFGVWGMGRAVPDMEGKTYMWYNHASNAPLSGTRQDDAGGVMLLFDAAGRFEDVFNAEGNGWDKPANINVQVFAHPAR